MNVAVWKSGLIDAPADWDASTSQLLGRLIQSPPVERTRLYRDIAASVGRGFADALARLIEPHSSELDESRQGLSGALDLAYSLREALERSRCSLLKDSAHGRLIAAVDEWRDEFDPLADD
jgi:predicted nucleic acid-binding Zn ribbon protein